MSRQAKQKERIIKVPPTLITDLYKTKPQTKQKQKENIINSIDYSTDTKHFPLRCFYVPCTWIVDEVFIDGNCFLFCVEGNSRYLEVYYKMEQWQQYKKVIGELEMSNQFDLNELLLMFSKHNEKERKIYKHVRDIKLIIWDDAPIHGPAYSFNFDDDGIQTKRINISQTSHSPMSILDRVVRTIRDLKNNFELKLKKTFPKEMKGNNYKISGLIDELADYYNKSQHRALEEMTGIRGMTPWNVHINEIIERQIIKYCQSWNYLRMISPHYKLEIGDKVLVKEGDKKLGEKRRTRYINNNQEYTITDKNEDYLFVFNPDNILVPRSRLVKIKTKNKDKQAD